MDVRKISNVTDYFLLASSMNTPHIRALTQEVDRVLGRVGVKCYRISGQAESEWIAMDYMDVVIHIFSPRIREYYALEELWKDAQVLG